MDWSRTRNRLAIGTALVTLPLGGIMASGALAEEPESPTAEADDIGEAPEPDWELSDEELAEMNEIEDGLAKRFDEKGIKYEVETDEDGLRFVIWDENDEAADEVADEYYEEYFDNNFDGCDFEEPEPGDEPDDESTDDKADEETGKEPAA